MGRPQHQEPAGRIDIGSAMATALGFTADRFNGWLWLLSDAVVISYVESLQPGRGHLSELFRRIHAHGFAVKVPNPLFTMEKIVRAKGFRKTQEFFNEAGAWVDVWVLEPPQ